MKPENRQELGEIGTNLGITGASLFAGLGVGKLVVMAMTAFSANAREPATPVTPEQAAATQTAPVSSAPAAKIR